MKKRIEKRKKRGCGVRRCASYLKRERALLRRRVQHFEIIILHIHPLLHRDAPIERRPVRIVTDPSQRRRVVGIGAALEADGARLVQPEDGVARAFVDDFIDVEKVAAGGKGGEARRGGWVINEGMG